MIFGNPDIFAFYADAVTRWENTTNDIEGITGIYFHNQFYITNWGLIAFHQEFENLIAKVCSLDDTEDKRTFYLDDKALLEKMIKERYPNWWANSQDEWEQDIDTWVDVEENTCFDLSLDSFSRGHKEKYHLFAIKHKEQVKLVFYIKDDNFNFYNFEKLTKSNIQVIEVEITLLKEYVRELSIYLSNFIKLDGFEVNSNVFN